MFLDLFSKQASSYAAARPSYPEELFRYLASLVPRRSTVWDCATGNGQAAVDLARFFDRVIATDGSPEQIAHAVPAPNVEYRVARADASGLPPRSVNLVTVAQALHWFPEADFFDEVRRVTVPGGYIAAWSYGSAHAGDDVEVELRTLEEVIVGPYWAKNRKWVDEQYRTIPFPFEEVRAPTFELRARWTLRQLGAYIDTWSAVTRYRTERGTDPVAPALERMAGCWGSPDLARDVTWPLNIRVGRIA